MTQNRYSLVLFRPRGSASALFLSYLSLLAVLTSPVRAAFVDVTIEYLQQFEQTSAMPPDAPRVLEFGVITSIDDAAASATLNGPSKLIPLVDGAISQSFSNRAAIEGAFPLGTFELGFRGGSLDGLTNTIPIGSDWWSAPPALTHESYDKLASIDPDQDLELRWSAFVHRPLRRSHFSAST
jgi:hypothetical protein